MLALKYALLANYSNHTHIFVNQRIECYLNNTITLRPLTPHIMPCYTHKMAIVSWPQFCDVISPYVYLSKKILEKGSNTPDQEIGPPRLCKRGCAPDDGVKSRNHECRANHENSTETSSAIPCFVIVSFVNCWHIVIGGFLPPLKNSDEISDDQ